MLYIFTWIQNETIANYVKTCFGWLSKELKWIKLTFKCSIIDSNHIKMLSELNNSKICYLEFSEHFVGINMYEVLNENLTSSKALINVLLINLLNFNNLGI